MAWDIEETRRRLKAAAVEEFAARGLAGTTMDSIARRASVNKERIYHYFGDKERLFNAVVADELARVAAAVPIASVRELDVGEFAGLVFDYHAAHPHLARLLHWEGLSTGRPLPEDGRRTGHYTTMVDTFTAAQRDGELADDLEAAHQVFLVIALAAWWFAVPQVVRMLTGNSADGPQDRALQRRAVVVAARRLALPLNSAEAVDVPD